MPLLQRDMIDPEKNKFLPPVTTPSSLTSDNRFLLPLHENKEKELPLHVKYKPPYAILAASILEVSKLNKFNSFKKFISYLLKLSIVLFFALRFFFWLNDELLSGMQK